MLTIEEHDSYFTIVKESNPRYRRIAWQRKGDNRWEVVATAEEVIVSGRCKLKTWAEIEHLQRAVESAKKSQRQLADGVEPKDVIL